MATPYQRFSDATALGACAALDSIGNGLIQYGVYSLVTGAGAVPLAAGVAATMATRYACSWDPDKQGPPPSGFAPIRGCEKVSAGGYGFLLMDSAITGGNVGFLSNNCIEITRAEYGPDPERPGKIAFFVEWLDIGNVPDNATFGNKDEADYYVYIDVQQGLCEKQGSPADGFPTLPPTTYTDPESGCVINVEVKGITTGQGGLASFVYKLSPGGEAVRADGGVIGGCNFSPVIYSDDPGGDGGGMPPFVGPWDPDWDLPGGGQTPWGDFLRDLAGGLLGNVIYSQLAALLEAPYPGVEYQINPSCGTSDPPELPVVLEIPPLKGLDAALTRIDALVPLLQAQKDLKQPICRDRPILEGEWRTISFRSEQTSPFGKSRLRKRFRYRSMSGFGLEQLVDHWASFSFDAGPVCVIHKGASWGTPQVWASTADEGKRVIRHAAGEAGLDPDQVGQWVISGSNSARVGVSGTMRVDTTGGYYWITDRDGPAGRPIVAKV